MPKSSEYTVGWICAISTEYSAAQAFLDERHDSPDYVSTNDNNDYTLGRVGKHNVVIAGLPDGEYGTVAATGVARDMLHSFPNVRIGLMVGIGGGAPSRKHDIRLGDVVVSSPCHGKGGVFQYDFGKTIQGQAFQTTGFLNQPPTFLRTAVNGLNAQYEIDGHDLEKVISEVIEARPRLRKKFSRPEPDTDRLYRSNFIHPLDDAGSCTVTCGDEALVPRSPRTEDNEHPAIHYGLIASANQLMKDASIRDKLAAEKNVLCFEMEAAGLMNHFPCLVVRGICDYSDTHKSKEWQGYAAMAAAAYAKDLLYRLPPNRVEAESRIADLVRDVHSLAALSVDNTNILRSKLQTDEDLRILDWLTPIDYGTQQSDFLQRRQSGTCQWLLHSAEYLAWLNASKQTLFCPGFPGTGKTVLTSVVVDHLVTRFHNDQTVSVAYIYCSFQRRNEQNIGNLLASLLKQLAQSQVPLPKVVRELYNRHKKNRTRPTTDEISNAIRSVAELLSKVFIVVDALDECQASDGCRESFISELFRLQTCSETNILATSRYVPEVTSKFIECATLEIRATDDDVKRYLEAHVNGLPSYVQLDRSLQEDIKKIISQAADGMFLLAEIYLGSLDDKLTTNDIRDALESFQNQVRSTGGDKDQLLAIAYDQAVDRINVQKPGQRDLAMNVISWITCARRPLTTSELQCALTTRTGMSKLSKGNRPLLRDMVSVCAGLVTVDEESEIIRLVHYTAQQYFERAWSRWFPRAEIYIATVCVTYLSLNVFRSGFCYTNAEFEERLLFNPLYDYASHNWGHHARHAHDSCPQVLDFLQLEENLQAASQALMANKGSWTMNYSQSVPRKIHGVHLAAYFGLESVLQHFLSNVSPDLPDSFNGTPLSYAAAEGHESVVNLLLRKGANVNTKSKSGRTALSWASWGGHEVIARLLLEEGADIDSKDKSGRTPLSYAAARGYETLVKLILENGAKVDSKDKSHRTPLSWAAFGGYEATADVLLAKGAQTDPGGGFGQAPIFHAAWGGHEAMVNLLLEKGSKIDAQDQSGRTILSRAAWAGHEAIVQLLLEKGADVDLEDYSLRTPLSWAAQGGHTAIVRLLLGAGAKVDSTDNAEQAPIVYAVREGCGAVVELLLEGGAAVEAKDRLGRTLIIQAAYQGQQEAIVKLLLTKAAKVNSKERSGRTALSFAAARGHEALVRLLIEGGSECNSKDHSDRTPLSWAAGGGYDAIARLLLQHGAEVDSTDKSGQTPLSYAAAKGHQAVVESLLEHRAQVNLRDKFGRAPLSSAVRREHKAIVHLLLERGADVNIKEKSGWMPLTYVAASGNTALVELLLEHGAEINSKDQSEKTPILHAALGGHTAIFNLLLEKGAEIDLEKSGPKLLNYSAWNGYSAMVDFLIDRGVRVDSKEAFSDSALSWTTKTGPKWGIKSQFELSFESDFDDSDEARLKWAAKRGYKPIVRLLLEKGIEVDYKLSGRTPLSYSAERGHYATVQLLLRKGAEIDSRDRLGRTPLHYAANQGHKHVVALLLERGSNINTAEESGRMPLSNAAGGGYEAMVKLFLEEGAKVNTKESSETPLICAATGGHTNVVRLLLERGAKIDSQERCGWTALSRAAWQGHKATVKLLLKHGAHIDLQENTGRTPLSHAAGKGHKAIVQLLLEEGAIIDLEDEAGRSPLSHAAGRGYEAVVRLLLERGAEVDSNDDFGRTPLGWAATEGYESIAELLLERGALVNTARRFARTPLSYAASGGHEAMVRLLLRNGAEVDPKEESGRTPLSYAAGRGHQGVVQMLLDHGAEVNSKDMFGRTPIRQAAGKGHDVLVKLLLDHGADAGSKDLLGGMDLNLAPTEMHETALELLEGGGFWSICYQFYNDLRKGASSIFRWRLISGMTLPYSKNPIRGQKPETEQSLRSSDFIPAPEHTTMPVAPKTHLEALNARFNKLVKEENRVEVFRLVQAIDEAQALSQPNHMTVGENRLVTEAALRRILAETVAPMTQSMDSMANLIANARVPSPGKV